jgi:hypothetical protein
MAGGRDLGQARCVLPRVFARSDARERVLAAALELRNTPFDEGIVWRRRAQRVDAGKDVHGALRVVFDAVGAGVRGLQAAGRARNARMNPLP